LKWFRECGVTGKDRVVMAGTAGLRIGVGAMILSAVGVTASASLIYWQNPGFLLGAGNGIGRWLENSEAGSGVEKALYRLMKLPGGEILYRRSPRETRPELTGLINANQNSAALYSLRALEDEQALDFDAAERDWKSWAAKADDKSAANLDIANFYERRLKPHEELTALEAVGNAAANAQERWTAAEQQRSWKAWERTIEVVSRYALGRAVAQREYAGWEQRYAGEKAVYGRELSFYLEGKDYASATALIVRYRKAFPADAQYPVRAEAQVEAGRGSAKDGLAVYDRSFQPLWPAELVKSYYDLLVSGHQTLKTRDGLRARLAAKPEGGTDALKDTAKLFYIYQQQGQLEAGKKVLADYRERKDGRGASWSAEELYTLGRLLEEVQDYPEAARYYYALAAEKKSADGEEKGLAGLTRILLTAPEQPLRLGAGNLALYKSIATMDRGPGYLNGILSLFLNSQDPHSEYANQDQLAVPYFHRAKAAELLAEIDRRFPTAPERAELHAKLMDAYASYGESAAEIREGTNFLTQFSSDTRRVEVALTVGDLYSRTDQTSKEFALYLDLLKELASKADGVPLGVSGAAYSKRIENAPALAVQTQNTDAEASETATADQASGKARSADYSRVLDRYLSRLVALHRLPEALELLRGELDRNPQDPGLYEKLATFLEQNSLNAHEEEVYQRAITQFQDSGLGAGWYAKLARFYLRQKRKLDYSALTHKVVGIFSGTELESYLREAPAPDTRLALEVDLYAHQRFPHDLSFVRSLLSYYDSYQHKRPAEAEKLLWEHWSESPDLRNQLFELLNRSGRLDAQLEVLRQQSPEIDKADWHGLAQSNPAAERFWLETCLWQSQFEQGVGAAEALAAEYPADENLGRQASSLYRSLSYFDPQDTDKAVAIEKRLSSARPDDLDTLARIGDIYADRGRMAEAAPYWTRIAEVHPGEANGYLQSATVFWDYFDFETASTQLREARERLGQPALFGYEAGAIEESQSNLAGAIKEYVASSLGDKPSGESRERLLALARRPNLHNEIEAETAELLKQSAPTSIGIQLRVSVLDAEHRKADMAKELKQAVARTDSFDLLDALTEAARGQALPEVEQQALSRQIALTEDPVHSLELRYQLVELLEQHSAPAAAAEMDAIYREHGKVLGVVRSKVDYDWSHARKPQAVTVLLASADAAYPELKQHFQLEAARKLTELGEYAHAKTILEPLLSQKPLDATIEAALADNYAHSGDQTGLEVFYKSELAAVKTSALVHDEKTARLGQLRRGMIGAASLLGDWGGAVDQYIELINAYPGDADLTQEAGLAAGAHSQRDRLLGFYRKTVDNSPRDARWSIVLARLETALEDYPAAIDAYGKAIHVRPEQMDLYESKADLEERLYKLDDAVADYAQLYKLSYHDPQWKVKEAEARARQGRGAEAVKALDEAWITGRPVKAGNYFQVAQKLEQWSLLDEARKYAEHGVETAGADLLVDSEAQSGALTYARIMARLRQNDAAFSRLALARMQAENVPLSAVAEQVEKDGLSAVTSEEWRKRRVAERREQARNGFAHALRTIAQVVGEYGTPEEKGQFAAWLQAKKASAANGSELRVVYLPAIHAAGFTDMEAELLWQFTEKSGDPTRGELDAWLQLEEKRGELEGVGAKLEKLSDSVYPRYRNFILKQAVEFYRTMGDTADELREMDKLVASGGMSADPRYYQLLLAARPQDLVSLSTGNRKSKEAQANSASQYLVANGKPDQAFAGIKARATGMSPVWTKAYTGLTGLYLREHTPLVRESFAGALGGDATIGERVAHPVNRNEQLAGKVWFYYGSRYGEYLDGESDAQAEGYLEAELEHTPERAAAYVELADYLAETDKVEPALADYRHSLDLHSDQPAILSNIAILEWKLGRKDAALADWQAAVAQLAAEMDARHVPESFWNDFTQVLGDAAAHGQYAAIREPVDAMLRIYVARNGTYRVESLLEAGYHSHGDSLDWLVEISSAASDQGMVLGAIRGSSWMQKSQTSKLLRIIVDLERRKAQARPGDPTYELDEAETSLMKALLDEKKFAEARAEFTRVPEEKRVTAQWLDLNLRLAEQEGQLAQLVAQWKKQPEAAPITSNLHSAVRALSEPSKRIVMRFVYEKALDARELTAPNFLGLAEIDLQEGDASSAVSLLKRLTLVSNNAFADADSAASLLETQHRYAEAIQFLQPLAGAFPWNASYKTRLAMAMLAGNAQSQEALTMLTSVAGDAKASYAERLTAAKALNGRGAANSGSAELDLLARGGCIAAEDANKPYFIEARRTAAACAANDKLKEPILRAVMALTPENEELRVQYLRTAFAAGLNVRALVAAEPVLRSGTFYSTDNEPASEYATQYGSNADADDGSTQKMASTLKPEDAAKLTWYAIRAREKRHEASEALALVTNAIRRENDPARLRSYEEERKRLETEAGRILLNEERAPIMHAELEQDRVVRPRLLPGMAFVVKKKAASEGDAE